MILARMPLPQINMTRNRRSLHCSRLMLSLFLSVRMVRHTLSSHLSHQIPESFKASCAGRCLLRFKALLAPVAAAFQADAAASGDGSTVWLETVDALHAGLCGPVIGAIVGACGERDGCDATPIAQM